MLIKNYVNYTKIISDKERFKIQAYKLLKKNYKV